MADFDDGGTPTIQPNDGTRLVTTAAPYLEAALTSRYIWDYGRVPMPVCGPPGTPCVVVRLHAPICYRYASFKATVVGGVPQLPHPDTGPNEELLRVELAGQAPGFMPSGEQVAAREGQYVYVCLVPPQVAIDQLSVGKLPMDRGAPEMNWIGPQDFDRSLLGTAPPVSGQTLTPKLG